MLHKFCNSSLKKGSSANTLLNLFVYLWKATTGFFKTVDHFLYYSHCGALRQHALFTNLTSPKLAQFHNSTFFLLTNLKSSSELNQQNNNQKSYITVGEVVICMYVTFPREILLKSISTSCILLKQLATFQKCLSKSVTKTCFTQNMVHALLIRLLSSSCSIITDIYREDNY